MSTRGVNTVVGVLEELGERPVCDEVVELAVVQPAAGQRLLAPALSQLEPRAELYTAFIVRGLLMLSVETSEVSRLPGREVWKSW